MTRAADDRPDTPPKAIKQARPEYPINQKQAGLIGVVRVNFVIDEQATS
jgi:outer membrane biosynthesis protein TonB